MLPELFEAHVLTGLFANTSLTYISLAFTRPSPKVGDQLLSLLELRPWLSVHVSGALAVWS